MRRYGIASVGSHHRSAAIGINSGDAHSSMSAGAAGENAFNKRVGERERIYFSGLLAANRAEGGKSISRTELSFGKILDFEASVLARAEFALQIRQVSPPSCDV